MKHVRCGDSAASQRRFSLIPTMRLRILCWARPCVSWGMMKTEGIREQKNISASHTGEEKGRRRSGKTRGSEQRTY